MFVGCFSYFNAISIYSLNYYFPHYFSVYGVVVLTVALAASITIS